MDNATASLSLMLKQLKLATMVKEWDALGNKAVKEQWSPQQYLSELCHIELANREDKRLQRLLKDAKLPAGKNLGNFDFNLVDGISKHQVIDLVNQPRWLKLGSNCNPPGKSEQLLVENSAKLKQRSFLCANHDTQTVRSWRY